jgi:aspartyl-tRNA(Asn)/glutamyl-tRNA(Gln) amidotransferase subunit A
VHDLHLLSAREALAAFRRRAVSPVEYLEALIARAEAMAPVVNAFGDVYFDEALDAARAAERRYATDGGARPLEGLPVAVKDAMDIAGRRTTHGSLAADDAPARTTEPIVARLLDAGAIVHARTLTPEFSCAFWTHGRMWGTTRNPWNAAYDVGGSSGGSAAAVACGAAPVATGSDIGGSIRVPASCCGVVGFKPPYGRIPQSPPFNLDPWEHVGPIARTVDDCALVADIVAGPHPRDHASLRPKVAVGDAGADVRGLRIGVSYDLGDWPVVAAVRDGLRGVADALRGAGAAVDEVPLTIERDLVRRASDAHHRPAFGAWIAGVAAERAEEMNRYTLAWAASLERGPSALEGLELEAEIGARVGEALEGLDALLCPTLALPAFAAGADYLDEPLVLDGRAYDPMHDVALTEVFNVAGRCPVLAVPSGRDVDGVPTGVQVVGRTYDDATVIRIGRAIEAARPWPLVAEPPAGA